MLEKIFKRISIKSKIGKFRRIYLFTVPVIQYEINNKKNFSLPLLHIFVRSKPDLNKPLFYLKFNSSNFGFSLPCLRKWIEVVEAMDGHYYIICDKKPLLDSIRHFMVWDSPYSAEAHFIKSDTKTLKKAVKNICTPSWTKAGFAHLTCFTHSLKFGVEEFFNIDADDTMFFENAQNIASSLKQLMSYAQTNDIDVFSLDMHQTRFYGKHFSFGVSFIRHNLKLVDMIKGVNSKAWQKEYESLEPITANQFNLDWYFTYLRDKALINAKSYNIENVYFAHFGFATITALSKLIQICDGKFLHFPFAYEINSKECLKFIALKKEVVCLNTGIKKEESLKHLDKMTEITEAKLENLPTTL